MDRVIERMSRLVFIAAMLSLPSPAFAQTYEPLLVSWQHMNLAELDPPWAMTTDGDFVTSLVHDGPVQVGAFELPGAEHHSTLVRVSPGGTVRARYAMLSSDIAAINRLEERVHAIVPMPDGRILTAEDRGPVSISTPMLVMRDASGAPLWTMQPVTDQYAMLWPHLQANGDIFVTVYHYLESSPERVVLPGNAGYTATGRGDGLAVMVVAGDTGAVRWSRFIGRGSKVRPRSDGSFVVIDPTRGFSVYGADGYRIRAFRFPAGSTEIVTDNHQLLGDDLLVTLRAPYRETQRLPGGGAIIAELPSRLEAFDLTTGALRWTRELPPQNRVRFGEPALGALWITVDYDQIEQPLAGESFDRRLARNVRVLSVDASGTVTHAADFEIPGSVLKETRVFQTSCGLFASGVAAPLGEGTQPSYFLMHVPMR